MLIFNTVIIFRKMVVQKSTKKKGGGEKHVRVAAVKSCIIQEGQCLRPPFTSGIIIIRTIYAL